MSALNCSDMFGHLFFDQGLEAGPHRDLIVHIAKYRLLFCKAYDDLINAGNGCVKAVVQGLFTLPSSSDFFSKQPKKTTTAHWLHWRNVVYFMRQIFGAMPSIAGFGYATHSEQKFRDHYDDCVVMTAIGQVRLHGLLFMALSLSCMRWCYPPCLVL